MKINFSGNSLLPVEILTRLSSIDGNGQGCPWLIESPHKLLCSAHPMRYLSVLFLNIVVYLKHF